MLNLSSLFHSLRVVSSRKISACLALLVALAGPATAATWTQPASGATEALRWVWGADKDNVWIVGGSPSLARILKWNGTAISAQTSPVNLSLNSVFGLNTTDVWIGGRDGTILRYNGSTWNSQTSNVPSGFFVYSIWGTDTNNVWAVANDGTNSKLMKWNGSTWSVQATVDNIALRGLWGTSTTNIWAVGAATTAARIYHFDGSTWSSATIPTGGSLFSAWGTDANNIWAVGTATSSGTQATIMKWDGTSWSNFSVSGLSAKLATGSLRSIWGTSTSNIYVAGDSSGFVSRWDGTTWTTETTGTTNSFNGLWVSSDGTRLVGSSGANGLVFIGTAAAAVTDTTPPTVVSIVRAGGAAKNLASGTLTASFTVTYSESVTGVAKENFAIEAVSGNVNGTIGTVTGSGAVYTVPVTVTIGSGEFRLKVIK